MEALKEYIFFRNLFYTTINVQKTKFLEIYEFQLQNNFKKVYCFSHLLCCFHANRLGGNVYISKKFVIYN
jgi:hypothetical protein